MITAENKVFIGLSVIIKNVYLVGESNFRLSNFWLVEGDSPHLPSSENSQLQYLYAWKISKNIKSISLYLKV